MTSDLGPQDASQRVESCSLASRPAKASIWPAVVALAAVAVIQFASIRQGIEWGDDYAMYVLHARNLATGRAYGDTGYIYNAHRPQYGPRSYPPVWPAVLSIVYRSKGFDLFAMKCMATAAGVAFVAAALAQFASRLGTAERVALVCILGLNPYLIAFKDSLDSDLLFSAIVCACLLMIDRACGDRVTARTRFSWLAAAGALTYLAYGTRTLGIALPPTLILTVALAAWRGARVTHGDGPRRLGARFAASDRSKSDSPRAVAADRRWLAAGACAALAIFAACVALQSQIVVSERSYLEQLRFDPTIPLQNAAYYAQRLAALAHNEHWPVVTAIVVLGLSTLGALGAAESLGEQVCAFDLFVPIYMTPVLLWPHENRDARFLIPILPIVAYYILRGARSRWLPSRVARRAALAAVLISVSGSYAARATTMSFGAHATGPESQTSRELYDYIRNHTAREDVIIATKPRLVSLYTGRRGAVYHAAASDQAMWEFLDEVGATYLVVPRTDEVFAGAELAEPLAAYRGFVARQADQLRLAFENRDFHVYRISRPTSVERGVRGENAT